MVAVPQRTVMSPRKPERVILLEFVFARLQELRPRQLRPVRLFFEPCKEPRSMEAYASPLVSLTNGDPWCGPAIVFNVGRNPLFRCDPVTTLLHEAAHHVAGLRATKFDHGREWRQAFRHLTCEFFDLCPHRDWNGKARTRREVDATATELSLTRALVLSWRGFNAGLFHPAVEATSIVTMEFERVSYAAQGLMGLAWRSKTL